MTRERARLSTGVRRLVITLRVTFVLTVLSIAVTVAPAWGLLAFMGGDWSLMRFTLWCAGMAPVSAALHHVFRLGVDGPAYVWDWRQLKASMVGLVVAVVASVSVGDDPIMALIALYGTTVAFGLMHIAAMELKRRTSNTSLERTRKE